MNSSLIIAVAECLIHELRELAFLRELSGVGHYEVRVVVIPDFLVISEDVVGCNLVDDLGRCDTIHLLFEDMPQPGIIIRIESLHHLTLVQALDDLCDVHARFHIQVRERVVWIIETAGIPLLKHIDHLYHDFARCEDLIGLLRRNVVEDILFSRFIKVVGETAA